METLRVGAAAAAGKRVHLPVVQVKSSLRSDGTREPIHPADVSGRFALARRITFFALMAIWAVLPWVPIGGHPALFLDVDHRRFYVFGATFNAQDTWLVFFLLTGMGFALVYVTTIAGRVWCGWACPQTVFLEGLYRPIERFLEGPRETRLRRDKGRLTLDKAWRKAVKHAVFLLASVFVAHVFLSYFVSLPKVVEMVQKSPAAHPEAFAWAAATTALFYGNFAFFREQTCLIVCPYGRLQSVLIDDDSLVVGYDERRGEPRGKVSDPEAKDCVDCNRCVVVCPTGIDIRNGLQMDCIGCTACIDACDDVMDRLGRPRGLIRYDSLNGLAGKKKRLLRPRVVGYTALLVAGVVAATFAMRKHVEYEGNLLRLPGMPYVVEGEEVRNSFELHLFSKRPDQATFEITAAEAPPGTRFVIATPKVTLDSLANVRVPVFVTADVGSIPGGEAPIRLRIHRVGAPEGEDVLVKSKLVGPHR